MDKVNNNRLFLAACISLTVTAMTFSIRAGILNQLNVDFALSDSQLGWVNSMAFLGFPVAMVIGGLLYNTVGPKKLMWVAFLGHILGLVLTIFAGGFWGLIISTFFIGLCMTITATSELGTQQWVEKILGNQGANGMLILALWAGIMAVGRFFAGPIIHKLNPVGVLWGSSIIATLGIFLLLNTTGTMTYVATAVFAIGLTYFWPTMIGFVGEYLPKTGALGMSIIGGFGMFGVSIWNPIIGRWLDSARETAQGLGMKADEVEFYAGQQTLDNLAWFPAILILLFGILYFYMKKRDFKPIT